MAKTKTLPTFEKVCEKKGINPREKRFTTGHPSDIAYNKLVVLIEDVNPKDWKPHFRNSDQYKYYPWFSFYPHNTIKSPSGFGLGAVGCVSAYSAVGSRLYFANREVCEQFVKKHLELYELYHIGTTE